MHRIETKEQVLTVYRLAVGCLAVASLFAMTVQAYASAETTATEYVDSVYSWGIWELGLEPSSGLQPAAGNPLNDRSRSLKFRPNDNSAYMARSIPVAPALTVTPPPRAPIGPATPVAPPPLPVGPPGFSSGAPTTADPRN